MFIKIAGGLLIVTVGGLFGILYSNRLLYRHKELANLRRIMQMLETEVAYGATPLPFALGSISRRTSGPAGSFFGNVAECLTKRNFCTLREAWNDSAKKLLDESSLIEADIELVKSFGDILGYSDREDQKKHFQLFYLQLKHQEELAAEEIKRSSKLYRSLGFLLGLAVFTVLV